MIPTNKIHDKFRSYWPEYKNKDITIVCKAILKEMGRAIKNPIEAVKREWGAVCKFLIQWEGHTGREPANQYKHLEIKITDEQKLIFEGKICPYCKQPSIYAPDSSIVFSRDFGPIYICKPCRAWVGVHKPNPTKALGRLANAELRELKKDAHAAFDPFWKKFFKTRQSGYKWLSQKLGIPREYTHIGMFGVETCKKVVELCKKELS